MVKFIKDNNLNVDVRMQDKRTPLMYSSFRNDVNTTNALINLKADIRAKDRYGLTPMAYAIMLNSADTARILLDQGVRFEEIEYVAYFIINSKESYEKISSLIINDRSIEIKYALDPDHPDLYPDTDINNPACVETCSGDKVEPFKYVSSKNLTQMAELMLSSGYKPKKFKSGNTMPGISDRDESDNPKNIELITSGWAFLVEYEDYKPMLDIFIKYDLPNSPTKEQLKEAYGECYDAYKDFAKTKDDFLSGKITLTLFSQQGLKRTLGYYEQYCTDENATFNDIKTFFAWANETRKNYEIDKVLSSSRNNPNKVIYIENNSSESSLNLK